VALGVSGKGPGSELLALTIALQALGSAEPEPYTRLASVEPGAADLVRGPVCRDYTQPSRPPRTT